jgi:hypothetical protein
MAAFVSNLLSMFPPSMLVAMLAVSLIVFVGTLIAIPFILVRLPENYFDLRVPRVWMKHNHPVLRWAGLIAKNVAGAVFLVAGISMLILPGQGILTILIGISLLDFPGKRRLEARIVGQRTVLGAINILRAKFGRSPFVLAPNQSKPDYISPTTLSD